MTKVKIIAEAGVNHNGSMEIAFKLIDTASEAGADVVKFQTFKADSLVTKEAKQAKYQEKNTRKLESQYEMLKRLELSYDQFIELKNYCKDKNIEFMSTGFDTESINFLLDVIKQDTFKVSSGDITNLPLIYLIAQRKVQIILSTGMATIDEMHTALAYIAYGLSGQEIMDDQIIKSYYQSNHAKNLLKQFVTILHCTTEYPTPTSDVNLNTIDFLRKELELPIGFSDHTEGILFPVVAIAKNVTIIEKHFTIDKSLMGPDHKASLDPQELKDMIKSIRDVEEGLGSYSKVISSNEIQNSLVARKSLVADEKIKKGEVFTSKNIAIKRPGTGISPQKYWEMIGKKSDRNYEENEIIK